MLGDSYPYSIVESLKNVGYSTDNPLYVDYVKISHHGSRNNISNELLDMIDCDRFLISTNGGNGASCHPDRETIANIACHAKRDRNKSIHLYFNYPIRKIENVGYKFIEGKELKLYNIVVHEDELENVLGSIEEKGTYETYGDVAIEKSALELQEADASEKLSIKDVEMPKKRGRKKKTDTFPG